LALTTQEAEVISGSLDTLAPLPNVLAYLSWKFTPRWMFIARLGYFTLDYDKYSGDMTNAHVMLNYSISPRWARLISSLISTWMWTKPITSRFTILTLQGR